VERLFVIEERIFLLVHSIGPPVSAGPFPDLFALFHRALQQPLPNFLQAAFFLRALRQSFFKKDGLPFYVFLWTLKRFFRLQSH